MTTPRHEETRPVHVAKQNTERADPADTSTEDHMNSTAQPTLDHRPDWYEGPGYHRSGLHVWVFCDEQQGISFEIDADARLEVHEVRDLHAALGKLLEETQR